ncbi:beta-1,2-xylosyltransferease XAX1-like [Typha latifolia]|uniref:beta-1,2-xylosyltransferease XAX1-like n=1 Tax=Typha latifolia TaxID=4733 RepID=UPI003C2BA4DB
MSSTAYARVPKTSGERKSRYDGKLVKNLSKIEPKKLGLGLVAGCCFVLLTYISLAKLFTIYSPVFASSTITLSETLIVPKNDTTSNLESRVETKVNSEEEETITDLAERNDFVKMEEISSNELEKKDIPQLDEKLENKLTCDENSVDEGFPYARPVVCEMTGEVRISPKTSSVFFVEPKSPGDGQPERRVRPYARKDNFLLPGVHEVVLKTVPAGAAEAPVCAVNYNVPAVIFSVAGYTGNFFHDMADVLIPLFLTSSHFKGEVQYFVTNYKPWWIQKYSPVLKKLSNYEVINFDSDDRVHCFPHAFLGLIRDRDLIIYPHATRNPRNYSMVDFTRFLRGAYGLPRDSPVALGLQPAKKPRMLIISRTGTRKLLNLNEVIAVSEELGFEVVVSEAGGDVAQFAKLVNSADAMLAVHGAGITNQIFLPTQAVMIQIVPWGKMDWMATNFYGQPARDMKLRYVEYYIEKEESTLIEKYPKDHLLFTNPLAVHGQGWTAIADTIMKQDVKINLWRFKPSLLEALNLLQE